MSSIGTLKGVAARFCPPYRVAEVETTGLSVKLEDPDGRRPALMLRHRHERRMFFRANYLLVESAVPGDGPSEDGVLAFRFRGPIGRQRARLRWRKPVAGGEEWARRLRGPLLEGLSEVGGVESMEIHWNARGRVWRLRLTTLSGSVVGGFMVLMPIPVPIDPQEVRGIIVMVDALSGTGA